jgi:UDP-N-acetylglucosamine 2-epimerase (non-hydrolysing)
MAPVVLQAKDRGLSQVLVHTGQHYDPQLSAVFFDDLGMPQPDIHLGVGSGSHAAQTARIMVAFEKVCVEHMPRLVIVAGDVNSTLACALTAAKLHIPVAHVEAGLRSGDRSMPEEINRILTDHLAELLFITEKSGKENLEREGIAPEKMHFVGNSMIDSLQMHLPRALGQKPWLQYALRPGAYGLVTLHRPSNVDDSEIAAELAKALTQVGISLPLLFPAHPRTRANAPLLCEPRPGVRVVEPLGYLEFLGLMARAKIVITDSGGIQEETTALGVPCVTVRTSTERPVTLEVGTNRLVAPEAGEIVAAVREPWDRATFIPKLWDGQAATRIIEVIVNWLHDRGY